MVGDSMSQLLQRIVCEFVIADVECLQSKAHVQQVVEEWHHSIGDSIAYRTHKQFK